MNFPAKISADLKCESPDMHLRFVERDGKRILQQNWVCSLGDELWMEWRDIPLVTEGEEKR